MVMSPWIRRLGVLTTLTAVVAVAGAAGPSSAARAGVIDPPIDWWALCVVTGTPVGSLPEICIPDVTK